MRIRSVAYPLLAAVCSLAGCSAPGPVPIMYGTDACDYCRMIIADQAFGCERVTRKGKVSKFDSIECLAASESGPGEDSLAVHSRWVTDFARPDRFLNLEQAIIVLTEQRNSPMGVGLVAVGDRDGADRVTADQGGRIISWEEAKQLVTERWNLDTRR
jgi:copper chaperone NosL